MITAGAGQEQLAAAVRAALPGAPVLGTGPGLAVLKGVGDPRGLIRAFGLAGRSGYQAAGHTRMATESAVTVAHSHPFCVRSGLCALSTTVRSPTTTRSGVSCGPTASASTPTTTPRWPPAFWAGAWTAATTWTRRCAVCCQELDGFYTLLVTTPTARRGARRDRVPSPR